MPNYPKWMTEEDRRQYRYRIRHHSYYGTCDWECIRREWTIDEMDAVLRHDITDRELARKIKRSIPAIQKKRWELNKEKNKGGQM